MRNFSRFRSYTFSVLLACLIHTPLANAALMALQPTFLTDANSDSISLDLVISDLTDFAPDWLGGFDLSEGFDPGLLAFASHSLGDFLGHLGLFEAIDVVLTS